MPEEMEESDFFKREVESLKDEFSRVLYAIAIKMKKFRSDDKSENFDFIFLTPRQDDIETIRQEALKLLGELLVIRKKLLQLNITLYKNDIDLMFNGLPSSDQMSVEFEDIIFAERIYVWFEGKIKEDKKKLNKNYEENQSTPLANLVNQLNLDLSAYQGMGRKFLGGWFSRFFKPIHSDRARNLAINLNNIMKENINLKEKVHKVKHGLENNLSALKDDESRLKKILGDALSQLKNDYAGIVNELQREKEYKAAIGRRAAGFY